MAIKHIFFASRELAESRPGGPGQAVISITDPGAREATLSTAFCHVLRLAFYDAEPADEYLPAPVPGLFDHRMARQIDEFLRKLQAAPDEISVMVHCEYGVSRSAAVALYVEAYSGAALEAREFTHDANPWVVASLLRNSPDLVIDIPPADAAHERRTTPHEAA
jgi:predicted protein tyrosine phosphatase